MAAAHHAAQRPAYSLPAHPSSSFPPDDLRLPSIKDLQFHYQPRRQDHPQPSESAPGYDHNHPQPQDRVVRHPPHWPRPPPHSISQTTHAPGPPPPPPPSNPVHQLHSQQHSSQPSPQAHEPPSRPPDYHHRHENNGYATPGLPLSAQTAPVPGSVNSGPAVRSEDYHPHGSHKRSRTGDRTAVASLRDTRPPSAAYHYPPSYPATGMPPPGPYHQSGPSSAVPPSPAHPTHSSPSPHQVQHHHPLPPQQSYGNYHPSQYSQPPPPRSTNVPHPNPVSAHPPPSAQTPTTPLPPPTPTSAPAQATQVLSYAPPSSSQEWETPPPPQPPQQHFQHYPLHATHPPPPPPPAASTPPAPSSTHHVQQPSHSHHPPPHPAPPVHSQPPPQTAHSIYQSQPQQAQTTPQVQAPAPGPTQPYAKTTSVNPTDFDMRGTYSTHNTASLGGSSPDSAMSKLVDLCSILYDFASRYAQLNGGVPGPTPHEIAEMASRANEVVRLLEELRRSNAPDGQRIAKNDNTTSAEDHRPPKRPWEDMAEEGQVSPDDDYQQHEAYEPTTVEPVQSTAELDMELIRTKRATTTAGAAANTGQPKSKYRKRSASLLLSYGKKYGADPTTLSKQRATPPGKCHSCNIRETPEWRRGPDGARTLCNACGLHYAKLMRKQNKMNPGPNGEPPPPIDMDMLRASTRAAEAEKNGGRSQDDGSPTGAPTHHQGSFQVITIPPPVHSEPPPTTSPTTSEHPQAINTSISTQASTASVLHIPPPPWSTSPTVGGRGYQPTEQPQQSFIRSSIPANSPR